MTKVELESCVLAKLDTLYRVAQRMTSSPADAEDLVASTLEMGFRNCAQCDGRFPIAWLIQIMRNLNLHRFRKDGGLHRVEDDTETAMDAVAHEKYMESITRLDIFSALERIPEEYRLAVTLCDLEELDYQEASLALGVPVGTIRSRLNRGRKLLQLRLIGLIP